MRSNGRRKRVTIIWDNNKHLPEELWREVLSRLPVKTLLIFRSVSKQFRHIIDNPAFILMHLINNNSKTQSFIFTLEGEKSGAVNFIKRRSDTLRKSGPLVQISPHDPFFMYHFRASLDGLILLSKYASNDLTLWNPCVRKSFILPHRPYEIKFHIECVLGFSPSTNDYKLAVLDKVKPVFGVYSLREGCWKIRGLEVANEWFIRYGFVSSKTVAYSFAVPKGPKPTNNMVEIASLTRKPICYTYTHVASFDFDVEKFSFVELPRVEQGTVTFLFALGDSLSIFGISRTSTCIWVVKKDGGGGDGEERLWSRWYFGGSDSKAYEFFEICSCEFVGKIVFVEEFGTFLVMIGERLKAYNLRTHEIRHLGIRSLQHVDAYMESLLLAKP